MEASNLDLIKKVFKNRSKFLSKHDYGKTLVIGGSVKYPGAGVICSKAALKSGVGYVSSLIQYEFQQAIYPSEVTRISIDELNEDDANSIKLIGKYDSVVFGCGLVNNQEFQELLVFLLRTYTGILIIDATGLSVLSKIGLEHVSNPARMCDVILTPNMNEFSKLTGVKCFDGNVDGIREDAIRFAQDNQINLLVKSYDILCISPDGDCKKVEGRVSSMGRAGTGDALSGLLGGISAYVDQDLITLESLSYEILIESAKDLETTMLPGTFGIEKIIDNIPVSLAKLVKD